MRQVSEGAFSRKGLSCRRSGETGSGGTCRVRSQRGGRFIGVWMMESPPIAGVDQRPGGIPSLQMGPIHLDSPSQIPARFHPLQNLLDAVFLRVLLLHLNRRPIEPIIVLAPIWPSVEAVPRVGSHCHENPTRLTVLQLIQP